MKSTKQTAEAKFGKKAKVSNAEIEEHIARAVVLKEIIDEHKSELETEKKWFADNIFTDTKTEQRLATAAGTAIQKITNSYSVLADKLPTLKELFKRSLKDFVSEKTTYGCTAKLRELLKDGDYEHSGVIRNAVVIKTSPSIDFVGVEAVASARKPVKKSA